MPSYVGRININNMMHSDGKVLGLTWKQEGESGAIHLRIYIYAVGSLELEKGIDRSDILVWHM